MYEIGDRIGAVSHAEGDTIYIFGFGEYKGESVPGIQAKGFLADMLKDANVENPCLVLDSGEMIWGCECWWGPEMKVKDQMELYTNVQHLSIEDARRGRS